MKYGLIFILLIGLWACEPPKKPQEGDAVPVKDNPLGGLLEGFQDLSVEFQELARPNKVQAWVDKLIVKVQPGKDMPQVAIMREGEVAEFLYQRTVRKSEFMLRDQRYYEPWILIKTKDGLMGWVHEGGVKYVAPGLDQILNPSPPVTNPTARTRSLDGGQDATPVVDFTIIPGKRVGPIKLTTSETELIRLYGPTQVSRDVVENADKQQVPCTTIMGGTNDEIRVTWKDETRTKVDAVYFLKPKSRWYTPQGLSVGISLVDLTKANKSPISFYGFDWTYSGTISSWRKGALNPFSKHFYTVLTPVLPGNAQGPVANFKGNQVFTSNTEGVEDLNLYVSKIVVYLD